MCAFLACRIYGCGTGRLHAGSHAATTAAASPEASAICEDTRDASQHGHAGGLHTTSNDVGSAAATAEDEQCRQRNNLQQNSCSEAEGTQRLPCPAVKALPVWPLAAELHTTDPVGGSSHRDPDSQQRACSGSSEAAHGLQKLHMHGNGTGPSMASVAALSEHDSHVSNAEKQAALFLQNSRDLLKVAVSQASTQPEDRKGLQRPHELIGRELFITASMLNHSCEPNCLVVREAGHARIVTQAPIEVTPHSDCSCRILRCLSGLQCIL